jgi:hypothetical protein
MGGIVTDLSNYVYVADAANNLIQKYDSNGNFLIQWGTLGTGPGQFNTPSGIAVAPGGNYIFVSDYYNDRIVVFAYAKAAPLIYGQPHSQTVAAGVNVTFGASVFGASPLSYRWLLNGASVAGASGATLTVSNIALSDSGSVYSVLVTNVFGSDSISNAVLTVLPAVVTTLPTSGISATGGVLNGSVALGPYQTQAWFEWGTDTTYGSIVGTTNIGASNATVVLSVPLNGLNGTNTYHYRVAASNSQGQVYGADQVFAVGLKPSVITLATSGTTTSGTTVNGNVNPQGLDTLAFFRWGTSVNYGHTTAPLSLGNGASGLGLSSVITGLVAGVIYHCQAVASNKLGLVTGADVGFTAGPWVLANIAPRTSWTSLSVSADGARLAAVTADLVLGSSDAGMTWVSNTAVGNWKTLASSADGARLVAAAGGAAPGNGMGPIYSSSNGGLTWTSNSAPRNYWRSLSSSADGAKIVVAAGWTTTAYNGPIYTSADYGVTWNPTSAPITNWQSVVCSADGTRLAAVTYSGNVIYTSTNSGSNWTANLLPQVGSWANLPSSADGGELVAASSQYIFIWHGTVSPSLSANLGAGEVALSWFVPSAPFAVQQSLFVSPPTWVDTTNSPSLVLTNLRNQILLSPANPATFYRLKKR